MKELSKILGFSLMCIIGVSMRKHDFFHYLTLLEMLGTSSVFIMFEFYSYKEDKNERPR